MSTLVPFAHAFAMERAIRTFLAVKGVPTIPCNEFSGRNEAHQQAPTTFLLNEASGMFERMVLPDLIRFPSFHAVEIKTQGYAPFMWRKHRTTGFQRRHYRHYRKYEAESARAVEIAFVHLVEDEIRGGTLDAIESAKTDDLNPRPGHSDVFYDYLVLPRWPEPLSEVLQVALRYGKQLGREGYSEADHASVIQYRDVVAKPNWEKHVAKWGPRIAA